MIVMLGNKRKGKFVVIDEHNLILYITSVSYGEMLVQLLEPTYFGNPTTQVTNLLMYMTLGSSVVFGHVKEQIDMGANW